MSFKAYDLLSALVPGFLMLLSILNFFDLSYDKDYVIGYTAIAFFLGYLINTIGSWLEGFYYLTWNGKPSSQLLNGKDTWKVKFYENQRVTDLLKSEAANLQPTNDELFSIAMRYANQKDNRTEDFLSTYAFSRSILTCVIIGSGLLISKNYFDWRFYLLIPIILIIWLRCKQTAYYYAREVLNVYLKIKNK